MSSASEAITLEQENATLREQLAEAESVLHAIQRGEIDAVVVTGPGEQRVFTLEGADHPYRVLVESMNEGAVTLNHDGVILYANPRLANLLGTSRSKLTGTRIADWAAPKDRLRLEDMVTRSVDTPVSGELALVLESGRSLPVRASFSTLTMQDEQFYCAIITDVSLAKHHAALEEAAEKIRDANDRLRQADLRKDEFLATLAHELRNPLAPIRSAAQVIKALGYQDEKLASARQMIERQVVHMTRLVDDLLELSRITLGRLQLQQKPVSLAELLTDITDGALSTLNMQQRLTVDIADDRLLLNGDAVRLSQAISNVIENAVKYTAPDGTIEVHAAREADQAVLRIRDTGIGIAAETLPRIFDMFVQGDLSDRRGQGGLGIGLALSRSIVDLHGGTIDATSRGSGCGSEFVICLPLDQKLTEEAMSKDDESAQGPSQGIMVVDDNVDAAESLRMLLELSGHKTMAVHGGKAALAALDDFRPDLVLLDIGLPDIDGYELARRIRARCGTATPTLVALSGWGREEDKQRAADAGIDAYYTKPVSPSVLARLVSDNIPARSQPASVARRIKNGEE